MAKKGNAELCIKIAKGEISEEGIELTERMREGINNAKYYIKYYTERNMKDMLDKINEEWFYDWYIKKPMTRAQENLCIRIARGDITEEGVKITKDMREEIDELKEYFKALRENGMEALVDAYSVDYE